MEMTASASFYRCTTTGPIGATLQPTVRLHGDLLNDGLRGINRIGDRMMSAINENLKGPVMFHHDLPAEKDDEP